MKSKEKIIIENFRELEILRKEIRPKMKLKLIVCSDKETITTFNLRSLNTLKKV